MPPLVTLFPTCAFCSEPANRWRIPTNAPWGLDSNFNDVPEDLATVTWALEGPPDDAYGTCLEHFWYERDGNGNVQLSAAGHHHAKRTKTTEVVSRAQRQRRTREQCRLDLLELLGGKCSECGTTDPDLLRVHWPDPRRGFEGTQLAWYRWLLEEASRLDRCVVRCTTHLVYRQTDLRADALAAYGHQCETCGVVEEPLWVVPKPGTPTPRYSGGKKMGSTDKLRWLAREGYPEGWAVRCPNHAHV